jgi:GMP synthase (glutamine-hydrolysing)
MAPLRLLVVEGNTAEGRARHIATSGQTPSEAYAGVLKDVAVDAVIDICFPADPGANIPDSGGIAGYDGVAITGSALNLWKAEPESLRQIELARAVFAARVPFFGSCWGLQVAAVAAGGEVRLNPNGRELGISRKITLTDIGRAHPMHRGRPWAFDAPTVHMDEIAGLPGEITITATNAVTQVQAAEIRWEGGTFWGVQYHPEYTLQDVAWTLARYNGRLIEEGFYSGRDELQAHVAGIEALHRDPDQPGLAWRLGIDRDILDPQQRLAEIANWISEQVLPARSQRSRD